MISLISIASLVVASVLGAIGALFFKLSASDFTLNLKKIITSWKLYVASFSYLASSFFFWFALKQNALSVVYPFVSLTYICVEFLSMKYLDEKMNLLKWVGIALIIIGVSFIGFGG